MHIVKLKPKRRCRVPRRPHPELDCFFDRFQREGEPAEAGLEVTDLEPFHPQPQH